MDADTLVKIMPWVTGGLGGSILTITTNRWLERRRRKHIKITTKTVNYSLGGSPALPGEFHVSYNGKQYTELLYFAVELTNLSRDETLPDVPILLQFNSPLATIIDSTSSSAPVAIKWDTKPAEEHGQYWVTCGTLHPKDSATLGLLLANGERPRVLYRGDSKVVVSRGDDEPSTATRVLVSMATGAIPLLAVPLLRWLGIPAFGVGAFVAGVMVFASISTKLAWSRRSHERHTTIGH